jgi:23S rRNA (cytidine1920-2'-O)/16S rRNA (cytidine1409-2'-O)-methyltransferase
MTSRLRADLLLVERGLFDSRASAQAAIAAGLVTADGAVVRKASATIPVGAVLAAAPAHPFVSRGGVKLSAALDHFGFDPADCVALDIGASTGGFSDVLISRGARSVYAVDVGRGQLHPRLRGHPRVTSFEQTDIRALDPGRLPEPPDLVAIDVSFVSLAKVLPAALALVRRPARLVALIKPQFEVGRRRLKNGVVRDEAAQREACDTVASAVEALAWRILGVMPSPILGGDGNREYLLGAVHD